MDNRTLAQIFTKVWIAAAQRNKNSAGARRFVDAWWPHLDDNIAAIEDVPAICYPSTRVHVRVVVEARLAAGTALDHELGVRDQLLDVRRNQGDTALPGRPFCENADDDLLRMGIHLSYGALCTSVLIVSSKMCTCVLTTKCASANRVCTRRVPERASVL